MVLLYGFSPLRAVYCDISPSPRGQLTSLALPVGRCLPTGEWRRPANRRSLHLTGVMPILLAWPSCSDQTDTDLESLECVQVACQRSALPSPLGPISGFHCAAQ